MSTPANNKSLGAKSGLTVQVVVFAGLGWGLLALLFFLLFGVSLPGEDRPVWYQVGTYVLEMVAWFCGALLCFRNWRSQQIVSGRNVWLSIGIGMMCYFVGQAIFGYVEIVQQQDPEISLADIFFVANYIFLIVGMSQAVFSKRLSLEVWQWLTVIGFAALGIAFAVWLKLSDTEAAPAASVQPVHTQFASRLSRSSWGSHRSAFQLLSAPAIAQQAPSPSPAPAAKPTPAAPTPTAPTPAASPLPAPASPASPQPGAPTAPASPGAVSPTPEAPAEAPSQQSLLVGILGVFYLVADVILLFIAMLLLMAFWGGRFSQSWRMIAAAALSLYVADIWFAYAIRSPNYQSGSLLEVGWVFTGILFGVGAALEYDLSTRSRGRRRRS